jgi:very-short-patch-repair endonuclease
MIIDDLLAARGVLTLRDHPRQARTIQRAAVRGQLVGLLPGVFVRPEHAVDPAVRLLATSAWARNGVICGPTAVELLLGRPISMPIRLRSPNRATPVPWLSVTRGRVPAEHRRCYRGINTVSLDYACLEVAPVDRGEAAFDALRRCLVSPASLQAALPAFSRSPGNPVRRMVARRAITNPWSFAEAMLHDLLDAAGITGWVANKPMRLDGALVFPDLWLLRHRLAIEFDGEAVHSGHAQFEEDRRRQNLLVRHGIRVLRFTWTMLREEPLLVVRTIQATLELS